MNPPILTAEFRDGMSLLPGAVTVVTTCTDEGPAGFTASAVCSVTDDPPTVLVCMNRSSHAHRFFKVNGAVCVNVLAGDQQAVSALFADRGVTMPERFDRIRHGALASGAPAIDDALVNLDGEISAVHEVGTHSLFIVRLLRIRSREDARSLPGLAWFNRRYHVLEAPQRA